MLGLILTLGWSVINKVYVGFIDLEKAYNRPNKEALWQVLRMYDVGVNY